MNETRWGGAIVLSILTLGVGTLAWFTTPDYSKCEGAPVPMCAEGNGSDLNLLWTLLTGLLGVITLLWLLGMLLAWLRQRQTKKTAR